MANLPSMPVNPRRIVAIAERAEIRGSPVPPPQNSVDYGDPIQNLGESLRRSMVDSRFRNGFKKAFRAVTATE